MKSSLRRKFIILLLCLSLLLIPKRAHADDLGAAVFGVLVGAAAVGAAIVIGIYFIAREPRSITECVAPGPGGLTIQNEGDKQTFSLIGDTASLKAGDRIKVSGKRKKQDASGNRSFLVEKLSKDYGPCKVSPATP